jgi:putative membrane protein
VGHDGDMMDGMMDGMMGGWMLLWVLIGVALLVLAVLAAIWLARRLSPGQRDETPGHQELLRRRYAAGEIDREEYLRMQRDLSGN